jgi:hypothetical protein
LDLLRPTAGAPSRRGVFSLAVSFKPWGEVRKPRKEDAMNRTVLVSSFVGAVVSGSILIAPRAVDSQTAPGPNHFKCYSTEGKEVADPAVTLRDQFDPAGAAARQTKFFKAIRFCNPV